MRSWEGGTAALPATIIQTNVTRVSVLSCQVE